MLYHYSGGHLIEVVSKKRAVAELTGCTHIQLFYICLCLLRHGGPHVTSTHYSVHLISGFFYTHLNYRQKKMGRGWGLGKAFCYLYRVYHYVY